VGSGDAVSSEHGRRVATRRPPPASSGRTLDYGGAR
jgi:hypothetical protein